MSLSQFLDAFGLVFACGQRVESNACRRRLHRNVRLHPQWPSVPSRKSDQCSNCSNDKLLLKAWISSSVHMARHALSSRCSTAAQEIAIRCIFSEHSADDGQQAARWAIGTLAGI